MFKSLSIKCFITSVHVKRKPWPIVTQLFYKNPTHIPVAIFSNDKRTKERQYYQNWLADHKRLEAAIIILLSLMIDQTEKSKDSIFREVRGKDRNVWMLYYQAILDAIVSAERTADSKFTAMSGVDFNNPHWDLLNVKACFEDLFLKFESKNKRIPFTDEEKVYFLTRLYERCGHPAVTQLNETIKNSIQVGSVKTWNEACNLFQTKEEKLQQEASNMIQARQLIAQYDKQPHELRAMYLPSVNAMNRTVETLLGKSKSTVNATSSMEQDIDVQDSFNGKCYNCGQ